MFAREMGQRKKEGRRNEGTCGVSFIDCCVSFSFSYTKRIGKEAPGGIEPSSSGSKPDVISHYTTVPK